jgi:endonuclease YncB( thermonuclease family)
MGWFSSSSDNNDPPAKIPLPPALDWINDYISIPVTPQDLLQQAQSLSVAEQAVLSVACVSSFALGFKAGRIRPSWRRWTVVADIADIGPAAPWLRGRVLTVSDGDTVRFLHAPTIFHSTRLSEGEKLSDTALAVRVCTIDTPETAKFGKPGQPYGDAAKDYLASMVDDRIVRVRILQKDQYGRAVAQIRAGRHWYSFWQSPHVDERMLKAGLAEVYRGGGAVYGHKGKQAYIDMETAAKKRNKGMWAQADRESAAEFKARMKAGG